jgi:hypothetical protein
MPVISATQEAEIRRIVVCSQPRQMFHMTISWKFPAAKKAGRVAEVVEHLPNKCEALSSNPVLPKNNNKYVYVYTYIV